MNTGNCTYCGTKLRRRRINEFKGRTMHVECYKEYQDHKRLRDWLLATGRIKDKSEFPPINTATT